MSNERFSSVWDAIEDTPAEAENMRLRSALMMALKEHITRTGLSQSQVLRLTLIQNSPPLLVETVPPEERWYR